MEYLILIPIALCCLWFLYWRATLGEVKQEQADALRNILESVKQANDARADADLRERVRKKYER